MLAGLPTRGHVPASQTASARALAGQPTHGHVPASQTVHARAPAGQTMRGHVPASQPTVARGPASQTTRGHVLASLPTPAHGQAGSVACGRDSAGRPAAGREIVYFYRTSPAGARPPQLAPHVSFAPPSFGTSCSCGSVAPASALTILQFSGVGVNLCLRRKFRDPSLDSAERAIYWQYCMPMASDFETRVCFSLVHTPRRVRSTRG